MREVWVEISDEHVWCVFKSKIQAFTTQIPHDHSLVQMPKEIAVGSIRHAIYLRERGKCVKCGTDINEQTMHMDEILDRGKGGLISLYNCQGLCADCHIGPRGKHGLTRGIRSGKVKP